MKYLKTFFGSKKRIPCAFCQTQVRQNKAFTIKMRTGEGEHSVISCPECMKTLQDIKGHMQQVATERDFDDDD